FIVPPGPSDSDDSEHRAPARHPPVGVSGALQERGHKTRPTPRALQDGGAGDEVGDAGRDVLEGTRRGHHACDLGLLDPVDAEAPGGITNPAPADEIPAAGTGHEDDRLDIAFGEVPAAVQVADP